MMKQLFGITSLLLLISCGQGETQSLAGSGIEEDDFKTFDSANHLQPSFEKARFDTLHQWDLAWALLEPINTAADQEQEKDLAKRFSSGQKLLYFFWYLDAEVTNGGFIQFYWNGKERYCLLLKAAFNC